jgi:hypothetical protein
MLTIIKPANTGIHATEADGSVLLAYQDSTLALPILPRPGNYAETVFIANGALAFIPGEPPVIAAHLSIQGDAAKLTIYPAPTTDETEGEFA